MTLKEQIYRVPIEYKVSGYVYVDAVHPDRAAAYANAMMRNVSTPDGIIATQESGGVRRGAEITTVKVRP